MGAAGGDAAPILKPAQHVIALVALAIERPVAGKRSLARSDLEDTRSDAAFCQCNAEPGAIVTAVAGQFAHSRQNRQLQGVSMMHDDR